MHIIFFCPLKQRIYSEKSEKFLTGLDSYSRSTIFNCLEPFLRFDCLCRIKNLHYAFLWLSSPDYIPPQGYKPFLMLNSAEHEILNANKYENIKKFSFFTESDKPRMLFFLLLKIEMPTVVGISTFMSWKNFILN